MRAGIAYAQANRLSSVCIWVRKTPRMRRHALGLTDGNVSGIAYAQANYSSYNLYTESEKNASDDGNYSLRFFDGNASAWASGMAEWNATESNRTAGIHAIAEARNRGIASGNEEIELKMAREALSIVSHRPCENSSSVPGDWYYQHELGCGVWNPSSHSFTGIQQTMEVPVRGFSSINCLIRSAFYDYASALWIYLRE